MWDAVRDVGAIHERLAPGFVTDTVLEDGGAARVVTFGNGMVARELIVDCDDAARRLAWSVVGGRMTHHNASLQIFAEGERQPRGLDRRPAAARARPRDRRHDRAGPRGDEEDARARGGTAENALAKRHRCVAEWPPGVAAWRFRCLGIPMITGAATLPRSARPEFTASANEYFRVWIVNLFFTLVTLGVYSAWAKVRKKKYFYGNTRLDGDVFDYFAEPVAILKGRAIAAIAFVAYAFVSELYPLSSWVFLGVGVAFLPWLIVRSATFGARCSSWRGLRFDFTATTAGMARIILGVGALVPLTLGLAYPYFVARRKSFVASHYGFGQTGFSCHVRPGAVYAIYARASLLFIALAAATGGWRGC